MKFNCTFCGNHIEASEDWYGTSTDCPHCGKPIRVPDPVATERLKGQSGRAAELRKKREKDKKLTRYLVAGLAALAIVAGSTFAVVAWLMKGPPVKVLEATTTQKIEGAISPLFGGYEIPSGMRTSKTFLVVYVKMPMHLREAFASASPEIAFGDGTTGELAALKMGFSDDHRSEVEVMLKMLKGQDFSGPGIMIFPPEYEPDDPTVIGLLYVIPKEKVPGQATFKMMEYESEFAIE